MPPGLHDLTSPAQALEPLLVQAPVRQPSVEALDEGVVHRLARSDGLDRPAAKGRLPCRDPQPRAALSAPGSAGRRLQASAVGTTSRFASRAPGPPIPVDARRKRALALRAEPPAPRHGAPQILGSPLQPPPGGPLPEPSSTRFRPLPRRPPSSFGDAPRVVPFQEARMKSPLVFCLLVLVAGLVA